MRDSSYFSGMDALLAPLGPSIGFLSVATGPDGSVYLADGSCGGHVYRIAGGKVYDFAGGGNDSGDTVSPATNAKLCAPVGLAVGPDGTVYIAEKPSMRVRSVEPSVPSPNRASALAAGILHALESSAERSCDLRARC